MRVLMIPLIVMSAVAGELTSEPNESQMRAAFDQTLAIQVRGVIAFADETGGPQFVQTIQQNGADRYAIRKFEKRACTRVTGQRSYKCDFAVVIDVVNGTLHRSLTGRFFAGPDGLLFAPEDPETAPHAIAGVL